MSAIHAARDLYERLPGPLKAGAALAARSLPVRLRYGTAFESTRQLLADAEGWDAERRAVERDRRLAGLTTAALRTPYWSDVFAAVGMPDGPQTAADLHALPLLSKDDVRSRGDEMLDPTVPERERKWVTTGGTTGVPLGIWIDKDASAADWGFVVDAWSRTGFVLDEPRVVLRGRRLGAGERRELWEYEPIRRELYVSTFDLDERHLPAIRERIDAFGARFIHGYPSALETLGRSYAAQGRRPWGLKALLAVSEALYPSQRAELERLFGCRVYSFYGMTEKAAFAAECEHSTELHVDDLYGVLELVDPRGRLIEAPGIPGEVVSTGLLSRCMPLFRYRTGDRASWAEGECACGRPVRRLRAVEGRWHGADALLGVGGARITMTALNVHSPVFDTVQRFRFLQETPGRADLLVVPGPGFDAHAAEAILRELRGKLDGQVELTIREVDGLPLTVGGKHLFIDQRVSAS